MLHWIFTKQMNRNQRIILNCKEKIIPFSVFILSLKKWHGGINFYQHLYINIFTLIDLNKVQ